MAANTQLEMCAWKIGVQDTPSFSSEINLTKLSEAVFDDDKRTKVSDNSLRGKYKCMCSLCTIHSIQPLINHHLQPSSSSRCTITARRAPTSAGLPALDG